MKKLIISIVMVTITINCFAQYTHPEGCHYRLIIETAFSSDTVCNKEYEGLGNLLHDMKILLNRLTKEEEYNDVDYFIWVKNITNGIETFDYFFTQICGSGRGLSKEQYNEMLEFVRGLSKEEYNEMLERDINETLEDVKQEEFKYFESKRLNLDIDIYGQYTDGKDKYIFDEEELTFKNRKKKPL